MTVHHVEHVFILTCVNSHKFSLQVEHATDITESHVTDDKQAKGFAIYRDRSLVECPYCKSYCHVAPGHAKVQVDFTPGR